MNERGGPGQADRAPPPLDTSWTLIHAAGVGSGTALAQFAERYQAVIRTGLAARWRQSPRIALLDDAVQEVLLECIRPGGALSKAESCHPGGFRAYLYGVMRNVMFRFESRQLPVQAEFAEVVADEGTVGKVFDREFALVIVKEASLRQQQLAAAAGAEAVRRVELLAARFYEGLAIREIAERWSVDPVWLHRQYAKAREEFLAALLEVVAIYHPTATPSDNVQTCQELLGMLGAS